MAMYICAYVCAYVLLCMCVLMHAYRYASIFFPEKFTKTNEEIKIFPMPIFRTQNPDSEELIDLQNTDNCR